MSFAIPHLHPNDLLGLPSDTSADPNNGDVAGLKAEGVEKSSSACHRPVPIKLGETNDLLAYHRVDQHMRLTSPNGSELDSLKDQEAGDTTLKSKYRQTAKLGKYKRNLSILGNGFVGLNSRRWIENGHVWPFGELGQARRIVWRFAQCLHLTFNIVSNWMFESVTSGEKP
ncbi:hypothetical protein H5410_001582 [Solanum commersonii]|uniref:Uncharacterized protein n=1 Tax=Solanum commersonii TaxID=4109 RepID=A0A9J6AZL2_SOLCO|nr:hypothetical protein H5410_001582 [Solanum commersonii]